MNGQQDHPHVPEGVFTPQRPQPASPISIDEQIDSFIFDSPNPQITLRDIDINNGIRRSPPPTVCQQLQFPSASLQQHQQPPIMELTEERFRQLQALAEQQAKQIEEGNAFASRMVNQLQDSQNQLHSAQQNITDLTNAFNNLSAQPRPLTVSAAPKKKPELPPFDSKNVLIWIRRVEAAYSRVGVLEPKDKFAWLESMFQVKLDPQIDSFLYTNNNSAENWNDFLNYLRLQYGPTMRQKAQKLMGEVPRHDLKPSQYLLQLKDDVKDVTIDHILKEHVLKSIPPRIREIMGKEVEGMSAEEVAKASDDFFDRQGRPVEKSLGQVNLVASHPPSTTSSTPSSTATASASFTAAFSDDDDTDVNFVRRGGSRGFDRNRSNNRGQRSRSRPNFNRPQNASSTGTAANDNSASSSSSFASGTCRWHRRFGDKTRKCVSDCPMFKSFSAAQKQGNGQGGRRM